MYYYKQTIDGNTFYFTSEEQIAYDGATQVTKEEYDAYMEEQRKIAEALKNKRYFYKKGNSYLNLKSPITEEGYAFTCAIIIGRDKETPIKTFNIMTKSKIIKKYAHKIDILCCNHRGKIDLDYQIGYIKYKRCVVAICKDCEQRQILCSGFSKKILMRLLKKGVRRVNIIATISLHDVFDIR